MKVEISSGVKITLSEAEQQLLAELSLTGSIFYDNLNASQVCVILNLLDKSVLIRKKKGQHVYYKLRSGINFSSN